MKKISIVSLFNSRPSKRPMLRLCLSLSSTLLLTEPVLASGDLWDMSLDDLGKIRVTSIASGTQTPLDKAAAIATVITEDDIAAMGATDLDQVLETVPGLHVGRSDQSYTGKYIIRGITSSYTPQTLLLINGIPVTSLFVGNRSNAWAGMPIKSIARIEVIRGPGSALYGADAFRALSTLSPKITMSYVAHKQAYEQAVLALRRHGSHMASPITGSILASRWRPKLPMAGKKLSNTIDNGI